LDTRIRRLGVLSEGGTGSIAKAITADGTVVVGESESSTSTNGREAFYWTENEGMVGLGYLDEGLFASSAYGISDDGALIVGSSGGSEAVLWDEDRNIFNLQTLFSDSFGLEVEGWDLEAALARLGIS
jgi:probable HAF family extracellular repeat protein